MARKKKTTTEKHSMQSTTANGKMSQMQAAMKVLRSARKPMSCREIMEAITKKKLWSSPGGKTPEATLYASILRDLRKGKDSRFKKTAPGKFALNR